MQDLTGKAVGIWLAISCFAAVGFEHCIANQFLITLGLWRGAHGSGYQYAIGDRGKPCANRLVLCHLLRKKY